MTDAGRSETQAETAQLRATLTRDLGLIEEPQDWGVVNADAMRIDEFIDYIENHDLTNTQLFHLLDLVLASVNEAMLGGVRPNLDRVRSLIKNNPSAANILAAPWIRSRDDDEFPIGRWLHQI